ncbi:Protein CBG05935 [Caenorhabditis briggsae]|uniref:Protein CBG05935 n=1 Tax=Caenorhabditis briggsae TaxID=6238 RepID=A8X1A7_CAEBR|nr:Protein CBG05935 [Caenorhabditis briggsae]CAP26417.2 Protein CBG05935 [Caenorhabditis briggsae]
MRRIKKKKGNRGIPLGTLYLKRLDSLTKETTGSHCLLVVSLVFDYQYQKQHETKFKFFDSWSSVVIYDLHIPLEHKNEATRRIIISEFNQSRFSIHLALFQNTGNSHRVLLLGGSFLGKKNMTHGRDEKCRDVPRLRQHCGTVDELPFLNSHVLRRFLNTFAFLRSSIDVRPDPKDSVQFVKQDSQYPIEHRPQPEVVYRQHNSSLIVLLVIIPLSVGGFAVCLIFLNYHCKMC